MKMLLIDCINCKSYNSNRITWALNGTINLFCVYIKSICPPYHITDARYDDEISS